MKFKKKKLNEQLLLGFSSKGSLFIFFGDAYGIFISSSICTLYFLNTFYINVSGITSVYNRSKYLILVDSFTFDLSNLQIQT